jgi:hypothetical protein
MIIIKLFLWFDMANDSVRTGCCSTAYHLVLTLVGISTLHAITLRLNPAKYDAVDEGFVTASTLKNTSWCAGAGSLLPERTTGWPAGFPKASQLSNKSVPASMGALHSQGGQV